MDNGISKARIAAFFTIAGGISMALWGGCSDLRLTVYSSSLPQSISAQQLVDQGPGSNVHVLVSDYTISDSYISDRRRGSTTNWFAVYPHPRATHQIQILLKSDASNSILGMPIITGDGLQGLVRDGSGGFSTDQRTALKKLGAIDFDKIWILDHNRPPPPWWSFLLKIVGGLVLVGVGALIWMASGSDD